MRAILVRGEPGFGKTAIWREAALAAETAGVRCLPLAAPRQSCRSRLVGLCDLIEPAFGRSPTSFRSRSDGRGRARRRGPARGRARRPNAARAVVAVLRLLAARTPVLLAIDDVQWLDAASRVSRSLRRSGALPIGALVTLRGGPSVSDPLDLANAVGGDSSRRSSSALSVGALRHLVQSRLAVRSPRPTMLRLHEASRVQSDVRARVRPSGRGRDDALAASRSPCPRRCASLCESASPVLPRRFVRCSSLSRRLSGRRLRSSVERSRLTRILAVAERAEASRSEMTGSSASRIR